MRTYSQSGDGRTLPSAPPPAEAMDAAQQPRPAGSDRIGEVTEVSGRGATAVFDKAAMDTIISAEGGDPLVGQIGSMVRIHVAGSYVYAIIRKLKTPAARRR